MTTRVMTSFPLDASHALPAAASATNACSPAEPAGPNTARQRYTTAGTTTDRYRPAGACTLLLMNASADAKSDLILLSSRNAPVRGGFRGRM